MGCVIDIETIPDAPYEPPELDRESFLKPHPTNYKSPEAIGKWNLEQERAADDRMAEALDEADQDHRKGSLIWDRARIICIGVTYQKSIRVLKAWDREDEADMLRDLMEVIPPTGPIVTFGSFDARIIRSRCFKHGIKFGPLSVAGKPWDRRVFDLQAAIADAVNGRASNIKGISVSAVAAHLGIPTEDNPCTGADVFDLYQAGRYDVIEEHARQDVLTECRIYKALKALDPEIP